MTFSLTDSCLTEPTKQSEEGGHLLSLDQQGRPGCLSAGLVRSVCRVPTRRARPRFPRTATDLQTVSGSRRGCFEPLSTQFNHVLMIKSADIAELPLCVHIIIIQIFQLIAIQTYSRLFRISSLILA